MSRVPLSSDEMTGGDDQLRGKGHTKGCHAINDILRPDRVAYSTLVVRTEQWDSAMAFSASIT